MATISSSALTPTSQLLLLLVSHGMKPILEPWRRWVAICASWPIISCMMSENVRKQREQTARVRIHHKGNKHTRHGTWEHQRGLTRIAGPKACVRLEHRLPCFIAFLARCICNISGHDSKLSLGQPELGHFRALGKRQLAKVDSKAALMKKTPVPSCRIGRQHGLRAEILGGVDALHS
jgi:hypothetical protein